MYRYLPLCIALAACSPSAIAKASKARPDPKTDRAFVEACVQAFDQSSGNGTDGIGRRICECAAQENHSQGATAAAIKAETAKIKADPKHKLEDPKLLASLQYCSIEILRQDE